MASDNTTPGDCAPGVCPVGAGFLSEPPSLAGSSILLAAFATLIPVNLWLGARYRTTTYSLILVTGLLLEVMGYVGRLLLRSDLDNKAYFLLFLLGTVTGPTMITAAVCTVLPHVLALYGSDMSVALGPAWLHYFFVFCNLFTLIFQGLGSAFAVEGFNKTQMTQGINIIVAGLSFQILSILTFSGVYFWFMSRIVHNREFLDPRFADIYLSARFKTALLCMQIALAFVFIRTVGRMVQLASGLDSSLSQSEIYVPVLDGALVVLASIFLTIMPPGLVFGRAWGATSPSRRRARHHLASLDLAQRRSYHLHQSPVPSPHSYQLDHGSPRVAAASQRHSSGWLAHKRQRSASSSGNVPTTAAAAAAVAEPPPYERPPNNYAKVPYMPPAAASLSQQYGQGRVVESQVVAMGSDGSRTGGSGSGSRTRTRSSPRTYDDGMVRHDSIW